MRRTRNGAALAAALSMVAVFGGVTNAFADFPAAHLVSKTSGRCLDVEEATMWNPIANLQLLNCREFTGDPLSGNQLFDQISIAGRPISEFKLRNQRTGKCLTYNANGAQNSPVWAERCDRGGQGWTRTAEKPIRFQAAEAANMCLDAVDPSGANKSKIDLYACDTTGLFVRWDVI